MNWLHRNDPPNDLRNRKTAVTILELRDGYLPMQLMIPGVVPVEYM